MTFTYDVSAPTDITRVRYNIADTESSSARYQDEEIAFVLSEHGGSVGATVLSLLRRELAKLASQPNFRADWLQVDLQYQQKALESLIDAKSTEYADDTDPITGQSTDVVYLKRSGM